MEAYQEELEKIRKILSEHSQGLTILEISEKIDINRNSVSKYMDVLRTNGIVDVRHAGPSKIFFLSSRIPTSTLMSQSHEGIMAIEYTLKIVRLNKVLINFLGLEKTPPVAGQFLTEEPIRSFYLEIEQDVKKALEGQHIKKDIVLKRGGNDFYYNLRLIPSVFQNGKKGVTFFLKDINDSKTIEKILKEEKEQLMSIFDSINQIIYVSDPKTYEIVYVNKFFKDILKKDPTGGVCYKEFHNKLFPCTFCTNDRILNNKGEIFRWEFHNEIHNRDFLITDRIIRWPDGRDLRLEIAIDISEIKESERKLKESEEELKKSQEIAGLGRWKIDLLTNNIIWSSGIYGLLGIEENTELTFEKFIEYIHPEDRKFFLDSFENSLKSKKPYSILYRILRQTGEIIHISSLGESKYNEKGEPISSTGTIQDVTRIREAEQEIIKSKENYQRIVETANEGIVIGDLFGRFTFVNQRWADMLGYSREEILGKTALDFVDEADREIVLSSRKQLEKGEELTNEYRFRKKDGSVLWVLSSASPMYDLFGNHTSNLVMHTDITSIKKAEEELKNSQEAYKSIVETSNEGIVIANKGVIKFVNQRWADMLGYSKEEILGKKILDFIDENEAQEKRINEARKSMESWKNQLGEFEFRKKDGSILHTLASLSALVNSKGEYIGNIGMHTDITEKKIIENELRRSEKVAKLMPFKLDLKTGKLAYHANTNLLKKEYKDFTFEELMELVHPDDRKMVRDELKKAIEEKSQLDIIHRIVDPNGDIRYFREVGEILYNSDGDAISSSGIMQDVTPLKNAEEELKKLFEIMQMIPWGIMLVDENHDVLFQNKFYIERFGECKEKKCYNHVFVNKKPCPACSFENSNNSENEWMWVSPEKRVYQIKIYPFKDSLGRKLILETATEITEKTLETVDRIAFEDPNPILRVTKQGILVFANPASKNILKKYKLNVGNKVPDFSSKIISDAFKTMKFQKTDIEIEDRKYLFSVVPIPKTDYANIYGWDITDINMKK